MFLAPIEHSPPYWESIDSWLVEYNTDIEYSQNLFGQGHFFLLFSVFITAIKKALPVKTKYQKSLIENTKIQKCANLKFYKYIPKWT